MKKYWKLFASIGLGVGTAALCFFFPPAILLNGISAAMSGLGISGLAASGLFLTGIGTLAGILSWTLLKVGSIIFGGKTPAPAPAPVTGTAAAAAPTGNPVVNPAPTTSPKGSSNDLTQDANGAAQAPTTAVANDAHVNPDQVHTSPLGSKQNTPRITPPGKGVHPVTNGSAQPSDTEENEEELNLTDSTNAAPQSVAV